MEDAQIPNFVDITGASADVARTFLEMAEGDLEQAIQLYFENPDLQTGIATSSAAPPAIPAHTRPGAAPARRVGREDAQGVIHIDSDDDGDLNMAYPDDDEDDFHDFDDEAATAAGVARAAQEDEDAAMAQRLQEQMYAEGATVDGVRSPIARTTETLVSPNPSWGPVDDDERDAMVLEQFRRRRQQQAPRLPNPFSQSIWDDPSQRASTASSSASASNARVHRLEDLFSPPRDLIARVPWDHARDLGKNEKKWIMVNLQDMSDFHCQALNRDIWKNESIKELVREHFVFLQYTKDDPTALEYITFYFPSQRHENPDIYPHVSIIDPRTGEEVKVWSGRPFPSASDFREQIVEFLDRYSLDKNSKNPVLKATSRPKVVDVDKMTEEEMLELALQNSMETNGSSSTATPPVVDPDSLTRSPITAKKPSTPSSDKVPDEEAPNTVAESSSAGQNAFSKISSNKPHTEPANDPKTTTRIQFKHATGRVIRRFNLADPVERIYEWLKAEPLEGKSGIEFELKKMPQGQDLLQELGKTIEEAGLKQGTVMVEFIEN